ncbi:MAG: septum formation initiator family protein [Antricoccus sp.]
MRSSSLRRTAAQPMRSTSSGASRANRRPGGITGRALLLGGLVIAVVLLLILPVSNYLHQKSQIDLLQQQIAAKQAAISKLNDRNTLLDDPAYIASQARERLNYIMPGEKVYVVSDNGPASVTAKDKKAGAQQKQKAKGSALANLSDAISKADQAK